VKAHELLNSPDKWCKGANALSESGASVNDSSPGACKWNLYGAIARCYTFQQRMELWHTMDAMVGGIVCQWADKPERTWQEVHDLLVKLDI
jgi:hypothetical protein